MIELVEKLGYDVETTTKFINEHNQKILQYWTIGFGSLLVLFTLIIGYIIYKNVTDNFLSTLLFMMLSSFCLLLYTSIPTFVFKPLLTEEKQIVQKKYKDVKNKDIDTSKYEVRISKDRKYLILDNKSNDIKFTYYPQKDNEGIKQPNDILHVVGESDKEFLIDIQSFYTTEPKETKIIKVPKDSFKITE